jgi:hypothetical protein
MNSLEVLLSDIETAGSLRGADVVNKEDEMLGIGICDPKAE